MTATSHIEDDPSKICVSAGRFQLVVAADVDLRLESLPGVGPKSAARLRAKDVRDQLDLLQLFPNRYKRVLGDASGAELETAQPEHVSFRGTVTSVRKPRRHSRQPLEVVVSCDGVRVVLVWFHVPGSRFADGFRTERWVEVEGPVDWSASLPRMTHPRTRWVDGPSGESSVERWEPVYPAVDGIGAKLLRGAIIAAFGRLRAQLVDVVPPNIRKDLELGSIADALSSIHAIGDDDRDWDAEWVRARDRVVYEEFYTLQLALAREQVDRRARGAAVAYADRETGRAMVRELGFTLTGAQQRVLGVLADELDTRVPMRRLLQGDVGSGKTVVAFLLAAIVTGSGGQVALMAPTEVLASQHLGKARALFDPHEVAYLGGSLSRADRAEVLRRLAGGQVKLVIGTHALFGDDVEFAQLGLVVVDEQHKFGVEQRDKLLAKGADPHLLAMTATPIPRSLAHSVFGDLDLAIIAERPPGREPVRTHVREHASREAIYRWLDDEVVAVGHQAYVVFPAITADARGFRSLLQGAEELANGWLRGRRIGVLHGRMDPQAKLTIMGRFAQGEVDVLCATTVVEVGVDVANATAMVIESAEAFGLSQLHQLRGRVGRGAATSRCVLVRGSNLSETALERLDVFEHTIDGFELAEMDLRIRGPGEFLGVRQAGAAEFRFADLVRDADLLQRARSDVRKRMFGDVGLR